MFPKLARNKYPLLFLLLTFISVNQWSKIPIGNTVTSYLVCYGILACIIYDIKKHRINILKGPYFITGLFLILACIGIFRGFFQIENYWDGKNLSTNSLHILFPLVVYILASPETVRSILKAWYPWAITAFFLFFYWVSNLSQFYLGPVYFALCFLPLLSFKRKPVLISVIFLLGIALATYNIEDDRSQFIKTIVAFSIFGACIFKKFIPDNILRCGAFALVLATLVLLFLGLTGRFNIFADTSNEYEGKFTTTGHQDGDEVTVDMSSDTRTFLYEEVFMSAIDNHYVTWGRTPARGHDTRFFASSAEELQYVRYVKNIRIERQSDEMCFTNIFTWLGLVGMMLYIAIYLYAMWLGLSHSKSYYVKLCACVVAFNFAYGWVENATTFDILNFTYWLFIAICLSPSFRQMDDMEFKSWFRSIFYKPRKILDTNEQLITYQVTGK